MHKTYWKKYVEFTVYKKPDKINKTLKFSIEPAGKIFFLKDAQLIINDKTRKNLSFENF